MGLYRVDQVWQLALVYEIRKNTATHLDIPLPGEYDEEYGKKYHYILLTDGEKGLGTLRINFENSDYAKIERVAVIKDQQFSGLGKQLMEEAEKWIKEKNYKKIIINSMYGAAGFYDKLGYSRDESIQLGYGPDGKRQIRFEKTFN